MPLLPNMEIQDYLDILRRRKWLIVFSFLFILFVASVYCVVVPETFKSSTTILVVPQRVPENYVRSTVSVNIENRLSTIKQQVLSRTRLQMVMEQLGLFKEERKKMPIEAVVERIRNRIDIQVRGNDSFMLSFIYENPQLAMLTTSRLASFFIDENLKAREQQAVGTSEFLESQLQEIKKKLEDAEEKVKQYKGRFMGELPQQIEANLSMLRGLQERFRANSEMIRASEDRRTLLESQIIGLERSIQPLTQQEGATAGKNVTTPGDPARLLVAELNEKAKRLADISAKYTDRYPEVRRLRLEVGQLEQRIREARDSVPATDNGRGEPGAAGPLFTARNPMEATDLRRLKEQISKTEMEISSLKNERESIKKANAEIQAKVERAPKREQEMISLTRDYDNLIRNYNELLKKKLDADVSQNLEKRQKGEQFQILDPANMPGEPYKPDRRKVFALALILALVTGFGGAIGLEMTDPTIRGSRDFQHFFQLPLLVSIPVLQDKKYERSIALRKAAVFGGVISFTAAVTVFLIVYNAKIRAIISF